MNRVSFISLNWTRKLAKHLNLLHWLLLWFTFYMLAFMRIQKIPHKATISLPYKCLFGLSSTFVLVRSKYRYLLAWNLLACIEAFCLFQFSIFMFLVGNVCQWVILSYRVVLPHTSYNSSPRDRQHDELAFAAPSNIFQI